MNYLRISFGIFIVLASSRFIPHPPNFTSLLALAFYIPAILGIRYIPALIISYAITDLFFGFHSTFIFTWGSLIVIGYISKFFFLNIKTRISGSVFGAFLFYLITNFAVWTNGMYGFNFVGLINCYLAAIPFFVNTIVSTILFSFLIEFLLYIKSSNIFKRKHGH
jgi:hypothetical protein